MGPVDDSVTTATKSQSHKVTKPRSLQVKARRAALDAEAPRVESLDEIVPKLTSNPRNLMKVCDVCNV